MADNHLKRYGIRVKAAYEDRCAPLQRELERRGIAVVENGPLVRLLGYTVDIGQEIPLDMYEAAAEVLALVFRNKET